MNAIPRLSATPPVHNGEEYLAESAESPMGWTHEDLELILSDNAVVAGREGERS